MDAIKWREDNGDETVGMDYPLGSDSLVVDVGGFKGDWVDKAVRKWNPRIYVFEPIDEFFEIMVKRFKGNDKIHLLNKGLSDTFGTASILKAGDKSRFCKAEESPDRAYMVDAGDWFKQFKDVDLVQINCEGGEYGILKRLIEEGLVGKIKHIKVQFHEFIKGASELREEIRMELRKTHKESYCYPFVWESWERI